MVCVVLSSVQTLNYIFYIFVRVWFNLLHFEPETCIIPFLQTDTAERKEKKKKNTIPITTIERKALLLQVHTKIPFLQKKFKGTKINSLYYRKNYSLAVWLLQSLKYGNNIAKVEAVTKNNDIV